MKHKINLSTLIFETSIHGQDFMSHDAAISDKIGAKKLGYSICKIPAKKRSCPLHTHFVNEEMFYIIKGKGTLRIGDTFSPITEGDFIAHPASHDPNNAHQIINDSDEELIMLCVSTMEEPDIVLYPDSGKFGVFASTPPGIKTKDSFRFIGKENNSLDYWQGEE